MKELIRKFALVGAICLGALTGAAATGKTEAFPVDLREGDRVSAGTEELTFSNLWDGDAEATVTIAQDGAAIFEGLSGEGLKTWTVDRNGRYVLTHTTYTNGVAGKVETAVFVVEGKEVPIGELTVEWETGSFMYDNTGKTPGATAKNGDQVLEKGIDYTVHYEGNTNAGTAKAILTGLPPYVGSVTNEFAIAKRLVELTSGTDSKAYDGTPLVCHSVTTNGDGFVAGEGVDFSFTGSQTIAGSSKNTFDYTFKAGTQAGNYAITKTEGDLTVTAAPIGPGGGEEPGPGPVPVGGLSKFDATYVYDGEGHTINTQALYAVTLVGSTPSFSFSLDGETGWQNDPFVYTNVGEYVMWYKITAPNYEDYKHQAKVTIRKPFRVESVTARQRYPWNGMVDITVTMTGEPDDVAAANCLFIATNGAAKTALPVEHITRVGDDAESDEIWTRKFIWDAATDVGAVKIDDVTLTVETAVSQGEVDIGGVQLWENGPYWAECNVGATSPEESGYYFWWGDTVGYKRNSNDDGWISAKDSSGFSFEEGNCPTYNMSYSQLQSNGYVDSSGNLAPAHDAATAHLGTPWRMPTDEELSALASNCTAAWILRKDVYGLLLTGKGDYSSKNIFLPAAGYGFISVINLFGSWGSYWSSTPCSDNANEAWYRQFYNSPGFMRNHYGRFYGQHVRPLRDGVAVTSCATQTHLSLDLRTGGRVSAGTEELTFSNLWDGDAEATVTIAQDGAAIFAGLTGEGVKTWSVDRNGRYVLTHTTYTNGVKGKVETAVFVVEGKEVPVSELTIDWGLKSFVYDGQPKEPVITVKDRGTTLTKGTHYLVEYKDNINVGTAKAIVKGIEPYVEEVTNTFTITKGSLPPDVKPDPIDPDPTKPDEPYSAFDYVGVYDGEGHTIDTNGLAAAYRAAVGAGFAVSYAIGENGVLGQSATPWSAVAPVFTNAATNVVWYKVSSANYEDIVHPAKVAIVPRAITVASVGGTWTYDTVAHGTNEVKVALSTSGQETASPFPEGEGIEVDEASFPTITDVGEKDNAFAWAFAEGTLAGNYAVTVKYGKLKVNARTIGDDDKNWDIRLDKAPMYNGKVQSAPIIQVCYVKPDGNLDYIPYELAGNTATDAGNYKVKISGKGNYSGTVEKDWAIMPRNLRMTSGTETWMYDGITHSNDTVTVTGDGFVEGEGATYAGFPQVTHFADAAEPVENAFTYKLNENTNAKNYEIVTEKGKVAMTRRPISLTAPTKSKTYDGAALTFGANEVTIGGEGYAEGEEFALSNFASITEAGQVAATFSIADGTALMDDYDITVAPGATLTVQKSATEITVTAKSKSWTYDGKSHELHEYDATNLGTLVGGDKLEVTFSADSVVTTPIDGENQDGVVENTITSVKVMRGDVDVSDNYTLAWYPGVLTVTKRPVTLTSKGASKSYDGTALTKHEVEVGGDGFVGEDGATYTFSGSQLDKGKSKNAFEYSLKSGTNAAYYEITKVEGELEVFPADISAGTELDWEIVLGPALTYNGIAQVQTVTSVKFKGLDLDYTVSGNQQTDAGDYELTLTGQGNFTGTKKVAWKLNPKAITITAKSVTRPYDGNVLMSWNSTTEGMVPGENAGAMTCTGNIKDVGSCGNAVAQLWWADNTKPSNYSVTKVAGTLTITPRPITVTSKNITKPFDGTPLTLQSSDIYTEGIVTGEKFYYTDFASRTEAGQTSATFTIFTLDNTKLTNYAITPVYGTITITKSATEIGVTARSKSWPYDATTHELHEYDATNLNILQADEELVVTFKEASKVTTPKDGPGEDGKVANEIESIRVVKNGSQDVTDNYTVTPYPGLLTVTKRPVTVTVEGKTISATYDGEEHTASGYDIATEDELYDIAAKTSFGGTDEVTRTDAGKSEMGLKPSDFTNSDEYFDVTYAVTDGWVDIAQADISTGEEGDFVLTLGANPKYNGTVQTIPVTAVTYKGLPVTYTLAGENATHAGTYTLTVKANGNFKGERSTTWKILKRQVKLTSGSASRAYNGQPLVNGDVTVSGDGFIGVEGATYSVTGSQTLAGSSKNAFAYTLKAGTQEGDYDITKVEGDLIVTKAKYPGQETGGPGIQWNVAADAATWMYDGLQHGVSLTGVPSGVTPHLAGNVGKDVGEYMATVIFDYDPDNYEPPVVPAPLKWTITQRPLSLQTVNAEKPYDGFPLTVDPANITPGLRGYAEGECFDYYDLASITEVGETLATFKYRDSTTAKVSNYAVSVIGDATLKITVGGDQISVTARDGIWGYDGQEHRKPEWDIVNGDKLLPGHEFQIKISEDSVIGTPKDGPEQDGVVSNTFEYVKIIETKSGADKTKNYNLFVYDGILKMTNACVSAEQLKGAGDIEKAYDGKPTNVTVVAALLQPATVRYGESVDEILSTTEPEFTDAGEYVVWYTVAAQYYNTYTNKVEVRIDKRPITLTSPTKTKPYDETALTFNGSEIEIGGEGYAEGEAFSFSDFASITDAGRVDATFKYAAGTDTSLDNYEVTMQKGTLTVSASAEEITLTAKTGEWPYDGETHVLHEYEIENENVLKDGDILVVEYDASSAVDTPDDGEVENRIVSFKVMRGGEEGEDVTRNYSIVTYPGKIKVVNATMTAEQVKVTSDECVYDGEGHTIEVEAIGLLTSPATVVYSESGEPPWKLDPMAVAVKNAGTHTIRYRVSSKFYNDYFGEATVKINPRKVTLLSSGAAKVFDGTPLRKNEVKVKAGSLDFVEGEGVTATCTSAQTGVGKIENGFNYEFNEGTLKDNYAIIPEFGWLEVTPGALSVDIEKSSYNGVYDGQPHSVSPVFSGTGLNLENCEVTYALVSGDESAYTPELPTFTDVGTYTVYVKIKAQNFEVVYTEMTVTITKATVETPVIPSKVYNGEIQTADVPPSELYTIYSNVGGKEVGEHSVALKLKDSKNHKWAPKDGVTIASSYAFMTFVITKGNNEWKVEPSIESWREDEEAKLPKAEAKYGKVTVEYKGTLKSGAAYSSPFSPMNPGSYVAMFTVAETEEYDGLYKEVPFTVTEKTVEPINVKAMGFLGIYDGKPHSISVTVTGGDGTPTITYATGEGGTYGATNPSYVEVGVYTVWYKVEFPNFAPIKGSAVVSISKGSGGGGEQTTTTPVPVPYSWLDKYVAKFGGGDYEKAGNAKGANGVTLWESYVAGLDPEDPKSQFKVKISIGTNGKPVVSWEPALNGDCVGTGERTYRVFGKVNLTDKDWQPDVDETTGEYRFFKVTVSLP